MILEAACTQGDIKWSKATEPHAQSPAPTPGPHRWGQIMARHAPGVPRGPLQPPPPLPDFLFAAPAPASLPLAPCLSLACNLPGDVLPGHVPAVEEPMLEPGGRLRSARGLRRGPPGTGLFPGRRQGPLRRCGGGGRCGLREVSTGLGNAILGSRGHRFDLPFIRSRSGGASTAACPPSPAPPRGSVSTWGTPHRGARKSKESRMSGTHVMGAQ